MPRPILEALTAQGYQQRQVFLMDDVNGQSQTTITEGILGLNLAGNEPITLIIDSLGGGGRYADWIADAIRCSSAPVNGLVVGSAYSSAFWVLQNCNRRIAYPHARLMTHGFRFDSLRTDQASFTQSIREAKEQHREILRLTAQRSGASFAQCKRWSREERNFLAPEALKLSLIDEIVTPKPLPGISE